MRAIDRKLLRDLARLWSQALTIALVVASGVAGFITSLSAVDSLAAARERFYAEARFADLFASVKRAPNATADALRELPGVAEVQTTIEHFVRVSLPGDSDPITGQLIGLPRGRSPALNGLSLRAGRWLSDGVSDGVSDGALAAAPSSATTIPVLVSAGFAQSRALSPGAELSALVNGRQRRLRIEGIVVSPEFVFAGLAGMPDMRGFGVFWLDHETLAAAYDMRGAFNRVALRLAPGADEPAVSGQLTQALARWGGGEAHGRDEQTSHAMLDNEIREQRVLGIVLPVIFLGVAAFLLNVVIARLVATQREQIAALKALGYGNAALFAHYLKLVLAIVGIGIVIGLAAGAELGRRLTGLYAEFFFFPVFDYRLDPALAATGAAVALAVGVAGTVHALLAIVRLAPAEAMRPPAPGHYRRTLIERLGIVRIATALRMILRQMERRPLRSTLSVLGVAAALAIVVVGNFVRDAMDYIVDAQFNLALRADVIVWMVEPVDARAAERELARLPGVLEVEAGRDVPVRLVVGPRSERVALQGWAGEPRLRRIVDVDERHRLPREDGLVLTDRLAAKLGAAVGDAVLVETLEGDRRRFLLPLAATVREMMGLNAYLHGERLARLLGEAPRAGQMALAVQRGSEAALLEATRALPRVGGAFSKATMWRNMQAISARNVRIMSTVMTVFACVIAVGVVYNNARIALAERGWELASLRVLGFSRGEVSTLLLGEMAIAIGLALPLGMTMGWGLVHVIALLLASDQFLFPVVIQPRTFALAALVIVAAALASALVVRRHVDRLDLVAVLKTRE